MTELEKQIKEFKTLAINLGKGAEKAVNKFQSIKDTLTPAQRKKVDKEMDKDENLKRAAEIIKDINFDL